MAMAELRKAQGKSQTQVAAAMRTSPSIVSRLETPCPKDPVALTCTSCSSTVSDVWRVYWGRGVEKRIDALPDHIVGSFYDWVRAVERDGMESVRGLPGYHDEKLRGDLKGIRSVRLTKAYRVLYVESAEGAVKIANVTRVSKHDYKK